MERPPARIGKYEVLGVIGQGAMGVVYKARDPLMNRLVALKKLSVSALLSGEREEEFKARFIQEAHAAGNLKHPNIVTIYDVDLAEGVPFMAMEYLEGGSLAAWMKSNGAMPLARAVPLVRAVGLGLAYAHKRGIVHRDIKPDNILLDRDGRPVITDFGAAHLQDSELTQTGEVLGTPHYMSPEQILSEPVDGRSDLFALGVVFYLLVTGKRPFKGDTVSSVCYHIVHSVPEPVPKDLPEIQPLIPVLERLLAKRREDRFATGDELASALDRVEILGGQEGRAPSMTQTLDLRTPTPFPARAPVDRLPAPGVSPLSSQEAHEVETPGQSAPPPQPPGARPPGSPTPARRSLWPLFLAAGAGAALLVVLMLSLGGWWLYRRAKAGPELPAPGVAPAPPASVSAEPVPVEPTAESPAPPAVAPAPRSTVAPHPYAPPSPSRVAPAVPPSPSPSLAASFAELERQVEGSARAAEANRFDEAFAGLDDAAERLQRLSASAPPSDGPAVEGARAALSRATASSQQALAAWAKPILDRSIATYTQATEHMNTDEDAIIKAYAEAYPVLRWKERLPADLAKAAADFVEGCRENLNDDEWATAEAAVQGKSQP